MNKIYNKLPRKLKYLVRAAKKFEAKLHRKLLCLGPNLERRMGKMTYPENGMPIKSKFDIFGKVKSLKDQKYDFFASVDDPEDEEQHVEYIEDCFPDMPRREFGWRVKYTIMKDERCTFDPNKIADINDNCQLPPCMPKCVITIRNNTELNNNILQSRQYAQQRQSGEGFRTSAPVDCRVTLSPTCDVNNLVNPAPVQPEVPGPEDPAVVPGPVEPVDPAVPTPLDPVPPEPVPPVDPVPPEPVPPVDPMVPEPVLPMDPVIPTTVDTMVTTVKPTPEPTTCVTKPTRPTTPTPRPTQRPVTRPTTRITEKPTTLPSGDPSVTQSVIPTYSYKYSIINSYDKPATNYPAQSLPKYVVNPKQPSKKLFF